MSRAIESPVKRWPGRVILPDYLTAPQDIAFQQAIKDAGKFQPEEQFPEFIFAVMPGIAACVEKWELQNFPENPSAENVPTTPRAPVSELYTWLLKEITALYEDDTIPNG